jgi:hypothetical protein
MPFCKILPKSADKTLEYRGFMDSNQSKQSAFAANSNTKGHKNEVIL